MNKLMLNNEWGRMFESLPDEKAGQLIKAVFSCHAGETVEIEDPVLAAVYTMIEEVVTKNRVAYEKTCARNAENGKNGGRPKNPEKPTETQSVSEEPSRTEENPEKANRIEGNRKEEKKKDKKDILSGKPDHEYAMPVTRNVLAHLNAKAGTHYRANNRQTVDKIKARLNDGFTEADLIKVIDNKVSDWLGTDMQRYLRPETLFGAKCESYLNELPPNRKPPGTKFQNFPARTDKESKDLVAQVIAMNAGG